MQEAVGAFEGMYLRSLQFDSHIYTRYGGGGVVYCLCDQQFVVVCHIQWNPIYIEIAWTVQYQIELQACCKSNFSMN